MYGLKPGDYLLRVSHVSYETASQTYRPEGTSAPIRVRLKASAIGLGEVTVRESFVEQRFDRYLVRLKGNSLTEAKNTMETLALMPGVTELGGSLQVNGQSVSEVYLNNRKLTDLSELENLPASYIDRIEILPEIRNRHDGTQKGGVIYIHMRRNPEAGGFGSVRVDAAIRQAKGNSQSIGVPFSYRVGKMNFYNNLYLGHYRSPYRTEFERLDEQGERLLTGYREEAQRAYRLNEVFSAVWEASPAHNLGINLTFQGKTSDTEASSVSNEAATTGEWIASTYDNQGDKSATRYQAGLDHLYKPGEGRIQSLHTVAEYLRQNEGNEERIADTTAHLNRLDDRLNLLTVKSDLALRLNDRMNLSVGLDHYSRLVYNDNAYTDLLPAGWQTDETRSGLFSYKGFGIGGYADYVYKAGKFTWNASLRVQRDWMNNRFRSEASERK